MILQNNMYLEMKEELTFLVIINYAYLATYNVSIAIGSYMYS